MKGNTRPYNISKPKRSRKNSVAIKKYGGKPKPYKYAKIIICEESHFHTKYQFLNSNSNQTRNMAGRSRTNLYASIYEDFQPQVDRKEEQGANILLIHLPGFFFLCLNN